MDAKAEKRVALAKDVLAQLEAQRIIPTFGLYRRISNDGACEVCALGSMMVACCDTDSRSNMLCSPEPIIDCLEPLFSESELAVIEAAFEGDTGMPVARGLRMRLAPLNETQIDTAATAFGPHADDNTCESELLELAAQQARDRLKAIMTNIIAHEGMFVPEAL